MVVKIPYYGNKNTTLLQIWRVKASPPIGVPLMLIDDETPVIPERRMWCFQLFTIHILTIFKELPLKHTPAFSEYMRTPQAKFVAIMKNCAICTEATNTHEEVH